jgi:uncharacterized membrane protein YbhN (UPF0104 family)
VLEGGLAGALIAYGASAAQAGAAVVLYHAIAFWIPAIGGLLAFGLLRRAGKPPRRRAAISYTLPVDPTEVLT